MAHRIIFQIVATGSRVVGRAFVEAYKQANASHKYAAAAAASGHPKGRAIDGLTLDEACRILNVKIPDGNGKLTGLTMEEVASQYKRLYDANDPAKGGSFYIQSKVYRAQERISSQLSKDEAVKDAMASAREMPKIYNDSKPPSR
ncbi:mitochondrial import inner membrane translocase subunit TIM16 [Orbilia ellipsospora]|uniref:Mitochondrial import inner membrane translocase subunit TIM16 n=1 Tax=Orbilia ellipsospora TaxID=2528407 RepID=A0AAV9XDR4_9PEZI